MRNTICWTKFAAMVSHSDVARKNPDTDDTALVKALTSPVRRRMLDHLAAFGPANVGTLANALTMRTGSVSHHLALLESVGLVEEHPTPGNDQRERWWKKVPRSVSYASGSGAEDEGALVRELASRVDLDHKWELARKWSAQAPEQPQWADASFATSTWLRLTPEQLQQFSDEYQALVEKWEDQQDPESQPVYVFAHGFPFIE